MYPSFPQLTSLKFVRSCKQVRLHAHSHYCALTNVASAELALFVGAHSKGFRRDRRLLEVAARQIGARHHHFASAPALGTFFVHGVAGEVRAAVGVAQGGAGHEAHAARADGGAAGASQPPSLERIGADDAAGFGQAKARVHAGPKAGFNEGLGFAVQWGTPRDDDAQPPTERRADLRERMSGFK